MFRNAKTLDVIDKTNGFKRLRVAEGEAP